MAKYDPPEARLTRSSGDEFALGFAAVERIVDGDVPPSASRPQWWAKKTRAGGPLQ